MKTIVCLAGLILIGFVSFSQDKSQTFYLKKIDKQKTAAWSMLAGGFTLMTVAVVASGSTTTNAKAGSLRTIEILFGAGALSTIGSIPLFIIAGKNRKTGMKLTVDRELIDLFYGNQRVLKSIPSLAINIRL